MKNISIPTIIGLALSPILLTPAATAEPVTSDAEAIVESVSSTTPSFNNSPLDIERVNVKTVKPVTVSTEVKKVTIERATFTAKEKPKPKPVIEDTQEDTQEATGSSQSASDTSNGVSNSIASPASSQSNTGAYTRDSRNGVAKTYKDNNVKLDHSSEGKGLSTVVSAAYDGIGSPYVWGGNTPSGWDCSGFVKWAYAKQGINIARGTSAILGSGQFTRTSTPQPGDLVFQNGGGHVGIYVGDGKMIGAQNPSVGTIHHDVSRNPVYGYYTLKK